MKHYYSDNGVYTADEFREDCKEKRQTQSFSGVGAKFQNACAELTIQTVIAMTRTYMVHVSLCWTEYGTSSIKLWPFAVKHAVWVYNRLPNRNTGLTPLELLTKTKAHHKDLLRAHVWGCPVYVLDPKLQDGKKIPKFNKLSCLEQFMGFSAEHSLLDPAIFALWDNSPDAIDRTRRSIAFRPASLSREDLGLDAVCAVSRCLPFELRHL